MLRRAGFCGTPRDRFPKPLLSGVARREVGNSSPASVRRRPSVFIGSPSVLWVPHQPFYGALAHPTSEAMGIESHSISAPSPLQPGRTLPAAGSPARRLGRAAAAWLDDLHWHGSPSPRGPRLCLPHGNAGGGSTHNRRRRGPVCGLVLGPTRERPRLAASDQRARCIWPVAERSHGGTRPPRIIRR